MTIQQFSNYIPQHTIAHGYTLPKAPRTSHRPLNMPTRPRLRRTRSMSPTSELSRSLRLEDGASEPDRRDRIETANFSLPSIIRPQELPVAGQARLATIFGVQLFHLDGTRDRDNTVAWWPYDIKSFTNLAISVHRPKTPREQLRQARLHLNRVRDGWQGEPDIGADEDFRIFDADGPRLIRIENHCPGALHWWRCYLPWDREGKVLSAFGNPFDGATAIALPLQRARKIDSPPPPQASKTFARPKAKDTPSGLPLPSLRYQLLGLLTYIRCRARTLLQTPGPETMKEHAILRNAFRDVLVTLAHMSHPPSKSTVERVDATALILQDSLLILANHHGILRRDTPLPYM
jgi:hypothetical protein